MDPAPRRRSSRLRGGSETPAKPQPHTMHQLEAVSEEHEESPKPAAPYSMKSFLSSPSATPRTPATGGRIKPEKNQMHPSMAKPSTAKQPDSGLRLGFKDIPSEPGLLHSTPSKIGIASEPSFDFKFPRPEATQQLGEEAQRMMDTLREDASKIKEKLRLKHEEEKRNGGESSLFSARKIAQPKPKAGRFSDVHMEEFKKMDSIAGHPSLYRVQADKQAMSGPAFTRPTASTLKRSKSQARLDETDGHDERKSPLKHNVKRSRSKAQLDEPDQSHQMPQHMTEQSSDRLENIAPAKRARQNITDDTSTARPVSRGGGIPVPTSQKPKPTFRSRFDAGLKSLTTPTKASAARASGLKQPSQIPSMSTASSMANLNATPKGLTKSKTMSNFSSIPRPESSSIKTPSKLEKFKSMLHRNPSPSKAAASSIPSLKKSPNLGKDLPSIPKTPTKDEQPQNLKHVSFNPGTVLKNNATAQVSPSPKKTGIPRSTTMYSMATATTTPSKEIRYPALSTPRPVADVIKQAATEPRPAPTGPPMFTFRSGQQASFGSSPGDVSIRAVRASILPSQIPGSFPVSDKKADVPDYQTVPHGISNKKRARASSDVDGNEGPGEAEGQSPSKKLKSRAAEGQLLVESLQKKIMPGGKNSPRKLSRTSPTKNTSPTKRKGVLSLSRLNMLARPKNRK